MQGQEKFFHILNVLGGAESHGLKHNEESFDMPMTSKKRKSAKKTTRKAASARGAARKTSGRKAGAKRKTAKRKA